MARITDLPPEVIRLIILDLIDGHSTDLANFLGAHDCLLAVAHMIEDEDRHKKYHGQLRTSVRLATLFGWRAERRGVIISMKGRQSGSGLTYTDWLDYCEERWGARAQRQHTIKR